MPNWTKEQLAIHNAKTAPKPTAPSKADTRSEKELQADMVKLLDQRGIFFVRSRMDKKTSTRVGMPDFVILISERVWIAVEVKVKFGSLSKEQITTFKDIEQKTGQCVEVVWSLDDF